MTMPVAELLQALWLTVKLASATCIVLLVITVPLAQWLNETRWRKVWLIEALFSLPVVLPPTVIGFYMLVLLSPHHGFGAWWQSTVGLQLTFSFAGLLLGSLVYSFPFALRPLQIAFRGVSRDSIDASLALGATPWQTFWRVVLPQSRYGMAGAAALVFAHTVGEFGVVMMIGGNIPGETRVASVALYDAVQGLDYPTAHVYAAILLIFSFMILAFIHKQQRHLL